MPSPYFSPLATLSPAYMSSMHNMLSPMQATPSLPPSSPKRRKKKKSNKDKTKRSTKKKGLLSPKRRKLLMTMRGTARN